MSQSHGSWKGIRVRDKNVRSGVIIDDMPGQFLRYLDVEFEGEKKLHTLTLRNVGEDWPDELGVEWEYNPGQWSRICRYKEYNGN